MSSGASYAQVAESGFITVIYLNEAKAYSNAVQNKFNEAMIHLARRMAQTKIKNEKKINQPLMSALIIAFNEVAYDACITNDQISSKRTRPHNLVFALTEPDYFSRNSKIEKPHKGNLILCRDKANELYIPHPDSAIPFILTSENIGDIKGEVGKKIQTAFKQGQKALNKNQPCRKSQRTYDIGNAAIENTADELLAHFTHRNRNSTLDCA